MKKENIHDKLFKHTLSIPSEAKALVRQFLPAWIHQNLDYRTFKLNTQSYVNKELDEYLTDIIYDCHWKGEATLKISFLLEHKSYPDKLTPLQLLRYLTEGYTRLLADKKKKDKATIIIPIVIYHDKVKWQKRTFSGLFELPDERFRQYLPNFDFELLDLSNIADDFLLNLSLGYYLRSTLLVFKHKNNKPFIQQFSEELFIFVKKELNEIEKAAFKKALLLYIFQVFKLNKQEFTSITDKIPKMTGIVAGSLYEQLINEGIEKGSYMFRVRGIRNMTIKKFKQEVIADLLEISTSQVGKIQKELKQETKIITALKKKQAIPEIAKKLKVSEWLVEVIQDLNKKKKED